MSIARYPVRPGRAADRYLEHARIYHFENTGQPEYLLASADWMPRNLDQRVELASR
jgi:polyphosphate kinase